MSTSDWVQVELCVRLLRKDINVLVLRAVGFSDRVIQLAQKHARFTHIPGTAMWIDQYEGAS